MSPTKTRNRDEPDPHNQTRNGFTPFEKIRDGSNPTQQVPQPNKCEKYGVGGWVE